MPLFALSSDPVLAEPAERELMIGDLERVAHVATDFAVPAT